MFESVFALRPTRQRKLRAAFISSSDDGNHFVGRRLALSAAFFSGVTALGYTGGEADGVHRDFDRKLLRGLAEPRQSLVGIESSTYARVVVVSKVKV
jgi:hypothetical protein